MQARARAIAAVVGSFLLVISTGCSNGSEDSAASTTTTKPAGKVSYDPDSDNPSVEYTDPDGNTSEFGPGASVPDGWPAGLVPPDSITVVSSSSSESNGERQLYVTGESTAALDEIYPALKAQLEAAGFEITQELDTDAGDYVGIQATNDDFEANVSIAADPDSKQLTILYTLTVLGNAAE